MTRYGGWDDPRWEDRERTARERRRSAQRDWPETYDARTNVGWRGGERDEIDPPWVERGPDARRAGEDPRGLVEWEDRGPIQWLGDKIREKRRSRGPKGYRRSDDRLQDAVCERIARSGIDARDVEVKVANAEVTLTGNVWSRRDKWWLEDMVDDVFGVEEVHNSLRVVRTETRGRAGEVGPSEPTDLRH